MIVRSASDLGLLIRETRRALGLDQQTLATRVGVSRLWISEFERGKPRAEIGLVLRTLLALDLRIDVAAAPKGARKGTIDIDAIVRGARKEQ